MQIKTHHSRHADDTKVEGGEGVPALDPAEQGSAREEVERDDPHRIPSQQARALKRLEAAAGRLGHHPGVVTLIGNVLHTLQH